MLTALPPTLLRIIQSKRYTYKNISQVMEYLRGINSSCWTRLHYGVKSVEPDLNDSPPDCHIYMGTTQTLEQKIKATPNGVAFILAPPVGLEPTTCGLTVRRSTD